MIRTSLLVFVLLMNAGCVTAKDYATDEAHWGVVDGRPVHLYTITNANGMVLKMTDYGAKIVELHVPDKDGKLADVVLGFDNLQQYVEPNQSIGATIGRFANRIRDGQFAIDGKSYQLTQNEGGNSIHGGGEFESVVWDSEIIRNEQGAGIRFSHVSPNGSHGFPGRLAAVVTFTLTPGNAVHVRFEAQTDLPTHVNFTQHSYFNLNGARATVHDHVAKIYADTYLVMDGVLASGEIDQLAGKAWDLSTATRLGDRINLIPLGGYHHNYVANKQAGQLEPIAQVHDPDSGRTLTVSTSQPGVVFYTAMGLTSETIGKRGVRYGPYMAFCVETQHHIDAPNHPQFPSTLLRPGQKYDEVAVYDFGVGNTNQAFEPFEDS